MKSDAEKKMHEWISRWNDIADFDLIRVITSAEAKQKVFAG
jgi:hypothetical protein